MNGREKLKEIVECYNAGDSLTYYEAFDKLVRTYAETDDINPAFLERSIKDLETVWKRSTPFLNHNKEKL